MSKLPSVLPVAIIFTVLAYLAAVGILATGSPALLIPPLWIGAAAICGYWHRQRIGRAIDRDSQIKAAFWLTVAFSIPALILYFLMIIGVYSTYSGLSASESMVAMMSDIGWNALFLPLLGLLNFLGLWIIFGLGFLLGHLIANRRKA